MGSWWANTLFYLVVAAMLAALAVTVYVITGVIFGG
jgi:hypothetical protein